MDRTYIESLMNKYGIEEEDAEIITELKKRIRKVSPLTKDQKEGCQVCHKSSKEETIYNHHMMKVEYLAILAYYYDLYKKEENPFFSPTHDQDECKDASSSKEYSYTLRKDVDLYIPTVAICERHHNMLHELAGDYEGENNKGLLKKAKPKELVYLYDTLQTYDKDIYEHIFEKSDSLTGREYYISYLKIWNDTLGTSLDTLEDTVDAKLQTKPEELGLKNAEMLCDLKERIIETRALTNEVLSELNGSLEAGQDQDYFGYDNEIIEITE